MRLFITKNKYIFVWVFIWQIVSIIISEDLILVSPLKVFLRIFELIFTKNFYISIINTGFMIFVGFALAMFFGIILAILCKKSKEFYDFLCPLINVIRVTPVASFIILALFLVKSSYLSMLIAFLMTLPVFFQNTINGFKTVDLKMLEMAKVFNFSQKNRIKYIYIVSLLPFFTSSISIGIPMAFKAGIAGEVIAFSNETIGGNLQNAKSVLQMADVFAWTIIAIMLSVLIEKLAIFVVNRIKRGFYDD